MHRFCAMVLGALGAACTAGGDGGGHSSDEHTHFIFKENADPLAFGGYLRRPFNRETFDAPTPFAFRAGLWLTFGGLDAALTACGEALETQASSQLDFEELRQPFESAALEQIAESGALLVDEGEVVVFAIRWNVTDVPDKLAREARTSLCLIETKVDIGETYVNEHNDDNFKTSGAVFFPGDGPFVQIRRFHFVSRENLKAAILDQIDWIMTRTLPLLNGENPDACRLGFEDPEDRCVGLYTHELLNLEEALRCAADKDEADIIRTEIEEIEQKLHAMSAVRDTRSSYYVEQSCPK